MDEASTREFDRVEALRRMEITRGLELATKDRTRAVRRERMRWAVRDRKLLLREHGLGCTRNKLVFPHSRRSRFPSVPMNP